MRGSRRCTGSTASCTSSPSSNRRAAANGLPIQSQEDLALYDPASGREAKLPHLPAPHPDGSVFVGAAYDPERDTVWAATYEGIHRLQLGNNAWESRYFDIEITEQEELLMRLSETKPPVARVWMAHHLFYFPIERRRDFAAAWGALNLRGDMYAPAFHSALTPFYADAVRKLAGTGNDYQFEQLLRLVD